MLMEWKLKLKAKAARALTKIIIITDSFHFHIINLLPGYDTFLEATSLACGAYEKAVNC
jgi:hypothetical protein